MASIEMDAAPGLKENPRDFFDLAKSQTGDVYSNNMDFVKYYRPEQVLVRYKHPVHPFFVTKFLTEHPKFEMWADEMDSGEMVSVFGCEWVTEDFNQPK
jgi:hypothetical protein